MEGSLNKLSNASKGLFNQKGGTFGLVLLAIGAVFFISKIGAIVAFVDSLLHLVIVLAVLAAIFFILTDKNTRLAVGTMYMMAVRWLLGAIVKMNPIAILEDSIVKMKRMIEKVEDNLGKLHGTQMSLKDKIKTKKEDLKDCLGRVTVAEKQGKKDLAAVESRQAVRLQGLVQDYLDLSLNTDKWYETLSRISDKASLTVQDAENEVSALKEKYNIVKMSHSAFKSAMSVLKGDPDQLAFYNMSIEFINKDIMDKVGEMDRVINSTGGMFDKMDVDDEVFSIKGTDLLNKYNELGIDALFTKLDEKPSEKLQSFNSNNPEKIVINTNTSSTNSKSKYF